MSDAMRGGCACGKVRFEAKVDSDDAYLCHCRMCQRSSGSVSLAMLNIARDQVRWEGEPNWYRSSPIASRPFCPACGTSLGFAFDDSDKMDLTVAAFDDPSRFRPTGNYCVESLNPQFIDCSGLPGKRVDEIESVTSRWRQAGMPTPA